MIEEETLMELRTIKTLLAIDKRDELANLTSDFSEIQEEILGYLDPYEWNQLPSANIAEDQDTTPKTVQRHRSDLQDRNLVEKRGSGTGAEYRLTGLMGCAELMGLVEIQ